MWAMTTPEVAEDIEVNGDADLDEAITQADESIERSKRMFDREADSMRSHLLARERALEKAVEEAAAGLSSDSDLRSALIELRIVRRKLRSLEF